MGQKWVKNAFFKKVIVDNLACSAKCLETILSPF